MTPRQRDPYERPWWRREYFGASVWAILAVIALAGVILGVALLDGAR